MGVFARLLGLKLRPEHTGNRRLKRHLSSPLPFKQHLRNISTESVVVLTVQALYVFYTSLEQQCVRSFQRIPLDQVYQVEAGALSGTEVRQLSLAVSRRGSRTVPALRVFIKVIV